MKESHSHLFYFANVPKEFKVDSFLCCNGAGMWDTLLSAVANGTAAETRTFLLETNELPLFVPVLFCINHEITGKWLLG